MLRAPCGEGLAGMQQPGLSSPPRRGSRERGGGLPALGRHRAHLQPAAATHGADPGHRQDAAERARPSHREPEPHVHCQQGPGGAPCRSGPAPLPSRAGPRPGADSWAVAVSWVSQRPLRSSVFPGEGRQLEDGLRGLGALGSWALRHKCPSHPQLSEPRPAVRPGSLRLRPAPARDCCFRHVSGPPPFPQPPHHALGASWPLPEGSSQQWVCGEREAGASRGHPLCTRLSGGGLGAHEGPDEVLSPHCGTAQGRPWERVLCNVLRPPH